MKRKIFALAFFGACSGSEDSPSRAMDDTGKSPDQIAIEGGLLSAVNFVDEPLREFHVLDRMAELNVPGLAFALIDDGEVAWIGQYGLKESGGRLPVDGETLFQAASMAKPVTAYAVMRMVDAGLLDLDAPIESYLSGFELPAGPQTVANPVTLRNILAHTAGLAGQGYPGYPQGAELPTDLQILRGEAPAITQAVRVENAPNTAIAYSGSGYTLIEYMLEQKLGREFADIMQEWVLTPLGMGSSTFEQPLPPALHERVAKAHDPDGAAVEGGWNNYPEQAAAGLWTTATDLSRFVIELRNAYHGNSALLSQPRAREMLKRQIDGAAVGILVQGEGDRFAFRHAGANVGYYGYLVMHLMSGDGAVYLANANSGFVVGSDMLRAASRRYGWSEMQLEQFPRLEVDATVLKGLAGTYDMNSSWQARVRYAGSVNQISLVFPNYDVYPLVPIGEGEFIYERDGTRVRFTSSGDVQSIHFYEQTGIKR